LYPLLLLRGDTVGGELGCKRVNREAAVEGSEDACGQFVASYLYDVNLNRVNHSEAFAHADSGEALDILADYADGVLGSA